ncbi:MAG TPA: hypothetical protein VMV68_08270 [Spirochaetia bacterium]|nr:hypothetical protein [Spirochaetia bacterium]
MNEMAETHIQSSSSEETISLLDVVRVLVKRRRFIVISTAIGAVFIVIFALFSAKLPNTSRWNLLPNRFTATAQLRLLQNPADSLTQSVQNSGANGLAVLLGGAAAAGPTNAELAIALLKGDTLADEVTTKMGFVEKYHITRRPLTTARSMFEGGLKATYTLATGILSISYTDPNKDFATKVVNTTIDALQNRFNSLNLEQVGVQTSYWEGRLAAAETNLQNTQDRLIAFMNRYGIVDLAAQSQAQQSQLAGINQQIQAKEIQLATLRHYGRNDNDPSVVQLKTDIQILQSLVTDLRSGSQGFNITGIPADQLPRISSEYFALKNNVGIQQQVYALVQQQYQTAKLQENAAIKTLQVVERATPPELASSPNRKVLCEVFTIAVFLLAIFVSFVGEYLEKARLDPLQAPKIAQIDELLGRRENAKR